MTNDEKKDLLLKLIDALSSPEFSKKDQEIMTWIQQLTDVYADGYRHSYSDLFYKLQEILLNNSEDADVLGENLNVLEERLTKLSLENKNSASLHKAVEGYKKFADHIRLEIGRYNFIKVRFEKAGEPVTDFPIKDVDKIRQDVQRVSDDVNKMRPIITQAQKALDNLDSKLENNKISSITALTIFSAVVLAFSGGLTFEAGVLQGMETSTAYRLVFVISLTGFVLFNTIFVLLYIVGKMTGKHISTKCKYNSGDEKDSGRCQRCGDGYCTRKYNDVSIVCRILHKYWYVSAVNLVLLWIMYADFILWFYKPEKMTVDIIVKILLPVPLIVFCCFVDFIQRDCQKKRNILLHKVNLVERILYPEEYSGVIYKMMEMVGAAVRQVVGAEEKDITEEYYDYIADCDPKREYKKIIRKTNEFIEELIVDGEKETLIVSMEQHKKNIRKWKVLRSELKDYLIKRDCNN